MFSKRMGVYRKGWSRERKDRNYVNKALRYKIFLKKNELKKG